MVRKCINALNILYILVHNNILTCNLDTVWHNIDTTLLQWWSPQWGRMWPIRWRRPFHRRCWCWRWSRWQIQLWLCGKSWFRLDQSGNSHKLLNKYNALYVIILYLCTSSKIMEFIFWLQPIVFSCLGNIEFSKKMMRDMFSIFWISV